MPRPQMPGGSEDEMPAGRATAVVPKDAPQPWRTSRPPT